MIHYTPIWLDVALLYQEYELIFKYYNTLATGIDKFRQCNYLLRPNKRGPDIGNVRWHEHATRICQLHEYETSLLQFRTLEHVLTILNNSIFVKYVFF